MNTFSSWLKSLRNPRGSTAAPSGVAMAAIAWATGLLALLLAANAFVLSYESLQGMAAKSGIQGWLSYLWPLTLDSIMLVSALAVIRNSLSGERALYAWTLVGLSTAGSVFFNYQHAPAQGLAQLVYVIPPVALFLVVELLSGQIKSSMRRRGLAQSIKAMEAHHADLHTELVQLETRLNTAQTGSAQAESALAQLEQEVQARAAQVQQLELSGSGQAQAKAHKVARQAQARTILDTEPDMSDVALAERLGVSLATAKRDKQAAQLSRRNGSGLAH